MRHRKITLKENHLYIATTNAGGNHTHMGQLPRSRTLPEILRFLEGVPEPDKETKQTIPQFKYVAQLLRAEGVAHMKNLEHITDCVDLEQWRKQLHALPDSRRKHGLFKFIKARRRLALKHWYTLRYNEIMAEPFGEDFRASQGRQQQRLFELNWEYQRRLDTL